MNLVNPYRFAAGGGGDPDFASVVLLVHMNGTNGGTTFTDSSSSVKTLTSGGNAQTSTAQSIFNGSSGLFDGSGDAVTAADSADFTLDGDFTIEGFFRPTTTSGARDVFSKRQAAAWVLLYLSSGTVYVYMSSNNASWNIASGVNLGAVSTGTWYYFAIKRSGSTITAHLGTSGSTSTVSVATSTATFDSSQVLSMGGNFTNGAEWFNGHLCEFRITNGVARDVSTVPTSSFPDS